MKKYNIYREMHLSDSAAALLPSSTQTMSAFLFDYLCGSAPSFQTESVTPSHFATG